jgi:hypothetical protein
MSKAKLHRTFRVWVDARTRHRLSDAHVQMARKLGFDPKSLGKIDNHRQQPWKAPLPQFIERLYREKFDRDRPAVVRSIEGAARARNAKRAARKIARRTNRSVSTGATTVEVRASASDEGAALAAITDIARSLAVLHQEARSLGVFIGDRPLLTCPTCGLMEDVLAGGQLVTYRSGRPRDTGLRFEEPVTPGAAFTCPSCRSQVEPTDV